MRFSPVEELVREIACGNIVILVDDAERENEGDFVVAAEKVTPETIRFMATLGRGLVCAPIAPEIADRLSLPMMTENPTDPGECAFTVSVDAREGVSTGISAFDRARTAAILADPQSRPHHLKKPGHLFPLRAHPQGLAARQGHTEASVELVRLAGFQPAAVICEVMKEDGTMARLPDLADLAEREGLLIGAIEDLVEYQEKHGDGLIPEVVEAPTVERVSHAELPTPFGVFEIEIFTGRRGDEIVALHRGDLGSGTGDSTDEAPLVRVHSACFTGEVFGSLRCDCAGQLQLAIEKIGEEDCGVVIYLPQEGRGIGLASKLDAYRLQDGGLDTVEANQRLGFAADLRTYDDAADILRSLGVERVRLLTNNPLKVQGLDHNGIDVTRRLPIEAGPGPANLSYLRTKKGKLGHLFEAI